MEDIRDFGMDLKEEIMNAVPDDLFVVDNQNRIHSFTLPGRSDPSDLIERRPAATA